MTDQNFDSVVMKKDTFLTTPIKDYFKTNSKPSSGFDKNATSKEEFVAGRIVHSKNKKNKIGSIAFYRVGICDEVTIPEVGVFDYVPQDYILLYIFDGESNNASSI
jgi:hypothetical protein